jgi:hypothetical protein
MESFQDQTDVFVELLEWDSKDARTTVHEQQLHCYGRVIRLAKERCGWQASKAGGDSTGQDL